MKRSIALAGLIMVAIGLIILALTDPLIRVLLFGARSFTNQFPSGFRSGNFTIRQAFPSNLTIRAYLLGFVSFGIAVVGLTVSFVGLFSPEGKVS